MPLFWDGQRMKSEPDVVVAPANAAPPAAPLAPGPAIPPLTLDMVRSAIDTHQTTQQHWTGFNLPPSETSTIF
jgi:hypothetical protein